MDILRSFTVAIIVTFAPMTALADLRASIILENLDDKTAQTYLSGIIQGLTFATMYMDQNGLSPKMYCMPDSEPFSSDLAAEAMRFGYEIYGDEDPGFLVILGMSKMFPCD